MNQSRRGFIRSVLGAAVGLVAGKAAAGGVFVEDGVRIYPQFQQKFDSNPFDIIWIDEKLPADTDWVKNITYDHRSAPVVIMSTWPKNFPVKTVASYRGSL